MICSLKGACGTVGDVNVPSPARLSVRVGNISSDCIPCLAGFLLNAKVL